MQNNKKNQIILSLFDEIRNTELTKNKEIKKKNILQVISYK